MAINKGDVFLYKNKYKTADNVDLIFIDLVVGKYTNEHCLLYEFGFTFEGELKVCFEEHSNERYLNSSFWNIGNIAEVL